jgi:hypothetical protein
MTHFLKGVQSENTRATPEFPHDKKPHEMEKTTRDSFVLGMKKKSTELKTSSARGQESTSHGL